MNGGLVVGHGETYEHGHGYALMEGLHGHRGQYGHGT